MRRLPILLLLFVLAGCGGSGGDAPEGGDAEVRTPVEVYVVEAGSAVLEVSATGTVSARDDVRVSAEAAGQVREVPVKVGDRVEEGEVLVKLDDELAKLAVQQAEAQLLLAEADLDNAEASLKRARKLWKEEDLSDSDFEAAERVAKAARAGHMSAIAARGTAGRQLRNTEIRSSIDGVVAFVYAEEGHLIGVGTPVAHVVNDDTVEIDVGLNEDQVVDVRKGGRATVRARARADETFRGKVEYVGPKADDLTRTYPVRVVVHNGDGLLKSGMVAEVTLAAREFDDVIVIERDWIVDRFGEPAVFVAVDSTAVTRKVALGRILGDGVIVRSGLEQGDLVVSFGHDQLVEGARVDIRNEQRQTEQ